MNFFFPVIGCVHGKLAKSSLTDSTQPFSNLIELIGHDYLSPSGLLVLMLVTCSLEPEHVVKYYLSPGSAYSPWISVECGKAAENAMLIGALIG